jgi:hypothetical protein
MTFWDAASLGSCVRTAAATAECRIERQRLYDRSVMVGRHTTTQQFNPQLPPYRSLVNRLENGDMVPIDQLRVPAAPSHAPEVVQAFFGQLRAQWNAVLDAHTAREGHRRLPPPVAGPMLARGLRAVEHSLTRGLGVGHSLSAVITIDERD